MNKLTSYLSLGLQVVILVFVGVLVFGGSTVFGGTTNYDALDVTDGYYVDGTQVITGSGVWSGAISSSNTATLSGTVSLTGTNRFTAPVSVGTKTILTGGNSTTTITAAQACANNYFEYAPSVANASATLPTQATLNATCLTTTGDRIGPILWKNTSNAASTTLFAAGASTTIIYANASTTTGAAPTALAGGKYARLMFLNTSSSDATAGVVVMISQFE